VAAGAVGQRRLRRGERQARGAEHRRLARRARRFRIVADDRAALNRGAGQDDAEAVDETALRLHDGVLRQAIEP
jgi:hypothetical protein